MNKLKTAWKCTAMSTVIGGLWKISLCLTLGFELKNIAALLLGGLIYWNIESESEDSWQHEAWLVLGFGLPLFASIIFAAQRFLP